MAVSLDSCGKQAVKSIGFWVTYEDKFSVSASANDAINCTVSPTATVANLQCVPCCNAMTLSGSARHTRRALHANHPLQHKLSSMSSTRTGCHMWVHAVYFSASLSADMLQHPFFNSLTVLTTAHITAHPAYRCYMC